MQGFDKRTIVHLNGSTNIKLWKPFEFIRIHNRMDLCLEPSFERFQFFLTLIPVKVFGVQPHALRMDLHLQKQLRGAVAPFAIVECDLSKQTDSVLFIL